VEYSIRSFNESHSIKKEKDIQKDQKNKNQQGTPPPLNLSKIETKEESITSTNVNINETSPSKSNILNASDLSLGSTSVLGGLQDSEFKRQFLSPGESPITSLSRRLFSIVPQDMPLEYEGYTRSLEDVFKFGNEKECVSLKNLKFILGGQKSPQDKLNNTLRFAQTKVVAQKNMNLKRKPLINLDGNSPDKKKRD
jgi:hypothetical protein